MAEFCLECYKRINGMADGERRYILSKDLDLCEGCGKWKPVVVQERRYYATAPFKIIGEGIYFLFRFLRKRG